MKLSRDELLFLSEVVKSKNPFGLFLKYPKEEEVETYKKNVIQSLKEKDILSEEEKFTETGVGLLLLWEAYGKCNKHMIVNQMFLSVLPNRRVIGIKKIEESYEIFSTDAIVVMDVLLKEYEFLRAGKPKERSLPRDLSYDDWVKELEGCGKNVLILGEYRDKTAAQEEVYYSIDDRNYKYNLGKNRCQMVSARDMRTKCMEYLNIERS